MTTPLTALQVAPMSYMFAVAEGVFYSVTFAEDTLPEVRQPLLLTEASHSASLPLGKLPAAAQPPEVAPDCCADVH